MHTKRLIFATFILLLEITRAKASNGTCSTMKQIVKTKQVPYNITYTVEVKKICGLDVCTTMELKSRTQYRTEKYLEYEQENNTCCPGYKKSENLCVPICSQDCVNGVCSAPDTCTCNSGYVLSGDDFYQCKPYCSVPCTNGKCSFPETCSCDANYTFDSSNKYRCVPICSKNCTNGICTAPETCNCNVGYVLHPKMKYICEPFCSKLCVNGFCEAPETCTCNSGYELDVDDEYHCRPICSKPCLNGRCSGTGKCSCNSGYVLDEEDQYRCKPYCSQVCINGSCSSPDNCTCNSGYLPDLSNKNQCNPKCSDTCKNGICTAPDTCACKRGYILNPENKFKCDPVCEKLCINSSCAGPNFCQCLDAHEKTVDENICKPLRKTECINGFIKNNLCECHDGYEFYNQTACQPKCKHSDPSLCDRSCILWCSHGNCVNNVCICNNEWQGRFCNYPASANIYQNHISTTTLIWILLAVLFGLIALLGTVIVILVFKK